MLLKKRKTSRGIFKRVKSPDDILAVIDIDSGQVSGAIFKKEYSQYQLVHSTKKFFSWDGQDFKFLLRGVMKSVSEVAENLAKTAPADADLKTFCFLPSLLSVSKLKLTQKETTEPFFITAEEIDKIASEETNKFLENLKTMDSFYDNDYGRLIESAITKVTANGYEWRGEKDIEVNDLSMSHYLSAASGQLLEKLSDKLRPLTKGSSRITFRSSSFAVFTAIRDLNTDPDNFLVADTRGELVDVFLVEDGILVSESSMPFGERSISRLAAQKGLTEGVIESFMDGIESGKLDKKTSSHINKILTQIEKPWSENFTKLLTDLKNDYPLPKKIWLVSNSSVGREFVSRVLLETDWRDFSYNGQVTIKNPYLFLTEEKISTILMLEKMFCGKILGIRTKV